MNVNRNQNFRKKASRVQTEKLPTENRGKRRYKIAAAILAVFVLHFAWQFSFIQSENNRIMVDSLNEARFDTAPVEVHSVEQSIDSESELAVTTEETKNAAKSIVSARYSPPDDKLPEMKKKAAREPRSERLRRAEKLLTGF